MATDWEQWLAEQIPMDLESVKAMDDSEFGKTLNEYQEMLGDEMSFQQRLECGRADNREITRYIADQIAQRHGLLDEWSGQSEAVYLAATKGEPICRIACHAGGGVSARAAGHERATCDIRLGQTMHDETSTHVMPMPACVKQVEQTIERIIAIVEGMTR